MKYIITLILTLTTLTAGAQSVGLVLSGGGAKGLYHIGIIKALEENNIPIDYVSGTSMGSIVAGLYAIGYTPDEIAQLFLSDQVKYWLTGKIESRYFFYFNRMQPNQAMVTLNLDLKAKKNIAILPTNLVPSTQLDMSFNQIFAPATAASGANFDKLFVPFRCVASDVYNKKEVIYREGDIGSAIRASMTIPLVFRPLKRDSVLLYDGGIYNNFPWQVLDSDFEPDILIGGKCVSAMKNPDQNNLGEQLEAITMMHTDYNLPEDKGIMIDRVFDDVGMLDFSKAQYVMDKGYEDAMSMMDSIKTRISRRVSADELHNRRLVYKSQLPDLIFDDYKVYGLNANQTRYVRRMMGLVDGKEKFDFQQFKSEYFKILSGGEIMGNYPRMSYNDTTGYFSVDLHMRTRPSFRVMLGGNISSTSLNQAYVGAEYKSIGKVAHTYRFDGNFSALYTSVRAGMRNDLYMTQPFYYDFFLNYDRYNYQKGTYQNVFRKYGYNQTDNTYFSLSMGIPLGRSSALQLRGNLGRNNYYYDAVQDPNDLYKSDRTRFDYYGIQLEATKRTLNYTLYPTRGIWQSASVSFVDGREKLYPNEVYPEAIPDGQARRRWVGARFEREEYFSLARWFSFGYYVDAVFSTHPDFYNEHATNFTSPAFTPTPYSHSFYIDKYRSKSYVGGGLMPTFEFSENFYLKNSGYLYMSNDYMKFEKENKAKMRYILTSSLVYQTPIGPASLTVTNFDVASHRWFVVFNFGYTLFNKKGLFY